MRVCATPSVDRSRQQGFSYLWLLFLIALMGFGLGAAMEVEALLAQRDQERALLEIGREFRAALRRYQENSPAGRPREYPATIEQLLQDDRHPGIRRYLRRLYPDPLTGKAEWGEVRVAGRIVGIHSLSSRVPIRQDGFDPDDAAFKGARRYRDWVFTWPPDLMLRAPEGGADAVLPTLGPAFSGQGDLQQRQTE